MQLCGHVNDKTSTMEKSRFFKKNEFSVHSKECGTKKKKCRTYSPLGGPAWSLRVCYNSQNCHHTFKVRWLQRTCMLQFPMFVTTISHFVRASTITKPAPGYKYMTAQIKPSYNFFFGSTIGWLLRLYRIVLFFANPILNNCLHACRWARYKSIWWAVFFYFLCYSRALTLSPVLSTLFNSFSSG
jgi:hypothetical protein